MVSRCLNPEEREAFPPDGRGAWGVVSPPYSVQVFPSFAIGSLSLGRYLTCKIPFFKNVKGESFSLRPALEGSLCSVNSTSRGGLFGAGLKEYRKTRQMDTDKGHDVVGTR